MTALMPTEYTSHAGWLTQQELSSKHCDARMMLVKQCCRVWLLLVEWEHLTLCHCAV